MSYRPLINCTPQSQLLLIDLQTRLASSMEPNEKAQVIRNSHALAEASRLLSIPLYISEQYPKGLGPTVDALQEHTQHARQLAEKTSFSCVACNAFTELLPADQRPQIIITGMEAHICVLQTAVQLHENNYQVFVVADAVCSRNHFHRDNALQRLSSIGITVTNTESVLFEWMRDAKHEQFKAISALIK